MLLHTQHARKIEDSKPTHTRTHTHTKEEYSKPHAPAALSLLHICCVVPPAACLPWWRIPTPTSTYSTPHPTRHTPYTHKKCTRTHAHTHTHTHKRGVQQTTRTSSPRPAAYLLCNAPLQRACRGGGYPHPRPHPHTLPHTPHTHTHPTRNKKRTRTHTHTHVHTRTHTKEENSKPHAPAALGLLHIRCVVPPSSVLAVVTDGSDEPVVCVAPWGIHAVFP